MIKPGFISKKADIKSSKIALNTLIYGNSYIGTNSIIDSYSIIGYPVRSKTKEIMVKNKNQKKLEEDFDSISSGSSLGDYNHIRPYTTIYERTILENNVETGTNVIIREDCVIGEGSIIGSGSVLDGGVRIGKKARIQSLNFIPPKIEIGDNVFLGPSVRFANDTYPVSSKLTGVKVKDNVIIGIGSIILPGITIGTGSIIAAGSLVTTDVPDNVVIKGSPAKIFMRRIDYDIKKKEYEK
ncbi:DapH/DapD/GlmU-related protein [Candidatus Hodarchaeum mangrovi]